MERTNRHFIAGHIWHLTHRCHKREFPFKFSKDRTRWIEILFEAKKRYQSSILNIKRIFPEVLLWEVRYLYRALNRRWVFVQSADEFLKHQGATGYQLKESIGVLW